jgi:sugar/nucleoside kinase (ribokinase family)
VLGNLAIDCVNDGAPQPGGCPIFATEALELLGHGGQVITRCAPSDRSLFDAWLSTVAVPVVLLDAEVTSAFSHSYDGERRTTAIDAIGDVWTAEEVESIAGCPFVHVAPLVRSDFPPATLRVLASEGGFVSYDGQGLVRPPVEGRLVGDAQFDHAILSSIQALKLSENEARVVAGGRFHEGVADDLGVPEVLLTLGSRGAVVYERGRSTPVQSARRVVGGNPTGAGDLFMVAYACARSDGAEPVEAARAASALVVDAFERRAAD